MSARMRDSLLRGLGDLRHEPTAKRIRANLAGTTVIDSTMALLLWEPRRVVPSYAIPVEDIVGELTPATASSAEGNERPGFTMPDLSSRPVLDPSFPFSVHTADGETVDLLVNGQARAGAGFLLSDPDLAGYLVLDFAAFDAWYEEDEPNVGHPRDPFHRIDALASSRHVRLGLDGETLVDSSRTMLLFETMLPTRYYVPREDVRADLVQSDTRTYCAYKGEASYWSVRIGNLQLSDIAWSYERPLHDALPVRSHVAFFDERLDVALDGQRQSRPLTRWLAAPE